MKKNESEESYLIRKLLHENEIRKMARDFVDKHVPKFEKTCSICGAVNCQCNDYCINCKIQF